VAANAMIRITRSVHIVEVDATMEDTEILGMAPGGSCLRAYPVRMRLT